MLRALHISKQFSGISALDDVSLELHAGKVNAIIGENGAGKSTLMKIVSGVYTEYDGTLELDGKIINFNSPKQAQDHGIAIIHQELNLIPELTIAENIFLGREVTNWMGFLDQTQMYNHTLSILKRLKLDIDPNTKIKTLKVGQQQIIEIAKAILFEAKVIIMDEPTSALSNKEVTILFEIIDELKKAGKAIAYISHKLDELVKIADTFTVLRDGKMIDSGDMKCVSKDELISKMVGRENVVRSNEFGITNSGFQIEHSQHMLLEVKNLSIFPPSIIRNSKIPISQIHSLVSFNLHVGEILGIFGLMGAGRTELMEFLFGLQLQSNPGEIWIENKKQKILSPRDAINAGIAFVSEDRKNEGIFPDMSVLQNISITTLLALSKNGMVNTGKEIELTDCYTKELNIKTSSRDQLIKNLSGGNQQKVILAKWLATHPKILLLDEPTRGIDVGAKTEIYSLIKKLATTGLGIVLASSELPEILAVCDRVLVLSDGRLTNDIAIKAATEEILLKSAIA